MKNSREIATQILTEIHSSHSFFETSISKNKGFNRLDSRDKAFVRLLILNTLRRNGQIQEIISNFVKKPLKKNNDFVLNLIRISICQILFLDLKEYSAVNTAVEISKKYKLDKFVNALLRNICRQKVDIMKKTKTEINIPNWIKQDILKCFGVKKLNEISKSIVDEPATDIKVKRSYCKQKNWEEILNGKFIQDQIIRLKNHGPIDKKPFFNEGFWWVQSLSSTIPVNIISSIYKKFDKNKISVLDVGAAPGGKTFQLIEYGFNVTSIEISERRTRRLKENLRRLNYETNIVNKDILNFKINKLFDCVLIDAPCTASGLIRKKPEILIMNKNLNLEKLVIKQKKILEKSVSFLKKGGYLLYCVCSIHSKEGPKIIDYFLKKNKDFELSFIDAEQRKFGKVFKDMLLVFPDNEKLKDGLDGFFIAVLRKK